MGGLGGPLSVHGRRAFKKMALSLLLHVAVVREFLDVVHQTKQFPLRINLLAPA